MPDFIESSRYLSKTTSTLWYFAPILNTVSAKMFAKSPKVFIPGGFPSAITSAWPSMSKQLASSTATFDDVSTCCVSMFANTDLLVECRLPSVVARERGGLLQVHVGGCSQGLHRVPLDKLL